MANDANTRELNGPVSDQGTTSAQKPWVPYEGSAGFSAFVAARWAALSPLNQRLAGTGFTAGEALVLVASVLVFGSGVAGMSNSTEGSGELAAIPLALAFATAAHNSVFTVFLGLPFERALFWHKYFAAWSVVLGVWHGLVSVYKS